MHLKKCCLQSGGHFVRAPNNVMRLLGVDQKTACDVVHAGRVLCVVGSGNGGMANILTTLTGTLLAQ